ncbi:MAG: Na-K-Cl cotransporter [Acidobacteria bacterium]|nr:MAG: Na-K-Cl cotransporter [Acidobacteriota bacterium]
MSRRNPSRSHSRTSGASSAAPAGAATRISARPNHPARVRRMGDLHRPGEPGAGRPPPRGRRPARPGASLPPPGNTLQDRVLPFFEPDASARGCPDSGRDVRPRRPDTRRSASLAPARRRIRPAPTGGCRLRAWQGALRRRRSFGRRAGARGRRRGPRGDGLGAFLGVFTPSILTILGVILYLRLGWVVGNVGLPRALSIVVLADLITLATALSLCSVATNMRVGAGGAYYIISRSLGIEIGAAIGIPLFLAQTFSVTLYAYGFVESLRIAWPGVPLAPAAAVVVLAVGALASRSAEAALKLQLPIMAAIGLSLVVLAVSVIRHAGTSPVAWEGIPGGQDYWSVFAVFFPAVTGIMAGVSLSGDLADPRRAIPRGTLAASLVGFFVYLAVPIALAFAADSKRLARDTLIWFSLAGRGAFLIFPGLWGAIFSSAVGSILGAPRTLDAMVDDRVLPRWLGGSRRGQRSGRSSAPALALSTGVALAAVALGGLDEVAPVLTMFFLTTYGMVNLVAGLEELGGDPSFRPLMRTPWYVSIAGAAACVWVMFLISRWACVAAIIVEAAVYLAMRRREMSASWGDLRRGALVGLVRAAVLKLKRLPEDPRNWRPHILLFAGDPARRAELVRYAAWLNQERGILTVAKLVVGPIETLAPELDGERARLDEEIENLGVMGFAEVDAVPDFEEGAIAVAQSNGIAGIHSNTVMFGWSEKPERRAATLRIVRRLAMLGKSSVIARLAGSPGGGRRQEIHVWWGGLQRNGDLLLMFAHLLSRNPEWRRARIGVMSIATNEMMAERNRSALGRMLRAVRIDAETKVILKPEGRPVIELIHEVSRGADVVLMGLREVEAGREREYAGRLEELASGLGTVLFVRNAGAFAGALLGSAGEEGAA